MKLSYYFSQKSKWRIFGAPPIGFSNLDPIELYHTLLAKNFDLYTSLIPISFNDIELMVNRLKRKMSNLSENTIQDLVLFINVKC